MLQNIVQTTNTGAILLIRLMVGIVFLSEGLKKFIFPATRGAGRFTEIGLPEPQLLGTAVGSVEMLCGIFILIGFLTRLASIPLIVIMLVAITTTKVELLSGSGIWEILHASRSDWAMLLGSLFLLIRGSGKWSVDYQLQSETALSIYKMNSRSYNTTGQANMPDLLCKYK